MNLFIQIIISSRIPTSITLWSLAVWLRSAECGGVWRSTLPAGKLKTVSQLAVCHSLVACCLSCLCVSVGAGLIPMCVFHQNSSHLPPPHPTALDHRTSRSIISLLFHDFFPSLNFLTPYLYIYCSITLSYHFFCPPLNYLWLLFPPRLTILTSLTSPIMSHSPFLIPTHLLAPCLPLFSPPSPSSLGLLIPMSKGWLTKLWSSQNTPVMRWTLLRQLEKSLFRNSFVHFWHQ